MASVQLDIEIAEAVSAARTGDRMAFARLVALTQSMVTALALSITADRAISEDIAQDTFLEAWRRLPALHTQASVLPWLREVARNKALDVLRQRRLASAGNVDASLLAEGPGPYESLEVEQRSAAVSNALQALSEDARAAILLYYREGQRSERVASLLGVSDAVVRKRLQRARERLRSEVEQQVGAFALHSAPGVAFGTSVTAALGPAAATTAGSATAAVTAPSALKFWLGKLISSAAAAVGLLVLAVANDTRMYLRQTRDRTQRRQLIAHGLVYAALMTCYLMGLGWMARAGVGSGWTIALALSTIVMIFLLTFWRMRIMRR